MKLMIAFGTIIDSLWVKDPGRTWTRSCCWHHCETSLGQKISFSSKTSVRQKRSYRHQWIQWVSKDQPTGRNLLWNASWSGIASDPIPVSLSASTLQQTSTEATHAQRPLTRMIAFRARGPMTRRQERRIWKAIAYLATRTVSKSHLVPEMW